MSFLKEKNHPGLPIADSLTFRCGFCHRHVVFAQAEQQKTKKTGHICCPPENDSPRNLHNDKASDLPGAMGTTCRESKEMMSVTTCWRHDHPDGIVSCSFSQEGQTMPDSCSLKYRLFQPSRKGGKMALTTNLVSNLEQPWCSSTYWPACNMQVVKIILFFFGGGGFKTHLPQRTPANRHQNPVATP